MKGTAMTDMEAMRAEVMTGHDLLRAETEQHSLGDCAHCGGSGEFRFLCQKPYVACTGCGATTATGEDIQDAANKWNRRP